MRIPLPCLFGKMLLALLIPVVPVPSIISVGGQFSGAISISFLIGGATHGFRRMDAGKHRAGMALSVPWGQTLSGIVCPTPIHSYSPCVWLQVQTLVDSASVQVLNYIII